ncbi:MAG: hypothetical protein QOE70_5727 [Chthoniobacter sp.]|jgi:hypothetical protein|nr:hypothetical protein [Chthoniobacter sp.]
MFLSPLFLLAAGLGASVPLLLHLMQNRRKVQLPFPTVRFLKLAEKHSSRRIKLENFLLWLLRTLIMALLGMAFAMPMIRRSGLGWLGEAPRDVAIVLDASYSMGYHTERGSVWDKGVEAAAAIIEGLSDKDRFCIYLAHEQPEALVAEPIGNKQEGLSRLRALQPGQTSSRLASAITAGMKALLKADARREREIHIVTDNQALPWQSLAAEKVEIDPKTAVFVSLLGVPAPENPGVASVELQPPVARKGADVKVTAKMLRTGSASDTTATLFIDEKEAGRRSIKAGDPEAAAPSFNLPPLEVGLHPARLQTPDDNLPIDDSFYFLIRVQDQMPSLVVGADSETLFLRTALRTGFGRASAVATMKPDQILEKPLSAYACIFLCNALPLPGQAIAAIEDYVKTGGVLVLFPGMGAKPDAYQAWNCLPGLPSAIEDLPLSQRNRTLTWDQPQHLLVRTLREGIGVPALAIRRRVAWAKVHEASERIVSMGANQPFLLDRPFGDGRVLMFAVAADRTWSDFPLSPFFLPLLLQCADYGAGVGAKTPFVWATDSLSLSERFPELKGTPTLMAPDGKPAAIRSAMVQGKTVLNAENVTIPGIYTLTTSEQPQARPALAVNLPRDESDLTPIDEKEIPKRLGVDRANLAMDLATLRRLIEEHRVGRTYGEHLLWLAFVLTAFEFIYANMLARGSKAGGEKVHVDAAGHVQTHAHAHAEA